MLVAFPMDNSRTPKANDTAGKSTASLAFEVHTGTAFEVHTGTTPSYEKLSVLKKQILYLLELKCKLVGFEAGGVGGVVPLFERK